MTLLPDNLLPATPGDLGAGRTAAIDAARAMAIPSTEPEEWRYSRIEELRLDDLRPAALPAVVPAPGDAAGRLRAALEGAAAELVLAGGWPVDHHSRSGDVTVEAAGVAPGSANGDHVTLLNTALTPGVQHVGVRSGARVTDPIVVIDGSGGEGELAAPRLRIEVGDRASAAVVHLVWSPPGRGVVVPVTELAVGDGAELSLVTINVFGGQTWALGRLVAEVGRDAHLGLNTFGTGGYYSRASIEVTLAAAGASLDNRGLYLGTDTQMHDFRLRQRHVGEHTTSRFVLRGAVRDRAEGVFTGVVRMEHGAKGADGAQDAKHLVLEKGAHVDSVPNLEIEENQVVCSHASSIGPVDADQVFYLESRGVPTPQATRLIARGFLREGEAGVGPPPLADALSGLLAERLAPELTAPLIR